LVGAQRALGFRPFLLLPATNDVGQRQRRSDAGAGQGTVPAVSAGHTARWALRASTLPQDHSFPGLIPVFQGVV
jgi:hypothetical protein